MDFWDSIKRIEGHTLKTLDQNKPFDILNVTSSEVIIRVHVRNKERILLKKEIEEAYRELITLGEISRTQIHAQYSLWNPAYVAAILAELPGVTRTIRPIVLHYVGGNK